MFSRLNMRKTGGNSIYRLNYESARVVYLATIYLGDHPNEDERIAAIFDPEYWAAADTSGIAA